MHHLTWETILFFSWYFVKLVVDGVEYIFLNHQFNQISCLSTVWHNSYLCVIKEGILIRHTPYKDSLFIRGQETEGVILKLKSNYWTLTPSTQLHNVVDCTVKSKTKHAPDDKLHTENAILGLDYQRMDLDDVLTDLYESTSANLQIRS